MTRFVDVPSMCHLLQTVGVARFVGELSRAMERDFIRWTDFDSAPCAAPHTKAGVVELLPVDSRPRTAFKYVGGHAHRNLSHASNRVPHHAFIHAPEPALEASPALFGMLTQLDTGYPVLLCELHLLGALRMAAASLMAARALARPQSRRMALIGNGAVSEFQAVAFHAHLGIMEIAAYDIDSRATEQLRSNLSIYAGLKIVRARSVAEALDNADIVTTVADENTRLDMVEAHMVSLGTHINAVSSDPRSWAMLQPAVMGSARVFVAHEDRARSLGEISRLAPDFPVLELWRVLSGRAQGRQSALQVTVFDSVGCAMEDRSALLCVLEQAVPRHIGVLLSLMPCPDDAKSLLSFALSDHIHSPVMRVK